MNGNGRPRAHDYSYVPSPSDLKLITALLANESVEEAAKEAGLSRATAYRRLQDDGFLEVLRDARLKAFSASLARIHAMSNDALSVIRELMHDTDAPASVRLRAATWLTELVLKSFEQERRLRDLGEVEEQLAEIRELIEGANR